MIDKYINNGEKFRKMFIEFETITKSRPEFNGWKEYDINDCINYLKNRYRNPYYREYEFIDFCRYVRNNMAHAKNDNYLIYTDDLISKFQKVLDEVKKPIDVYNKSIKNIYSQTLDSYVRKTMIDMKNKNYTHVPIYDNNKLVGIFSEDSIFKYLLNDKIIEIDDATKFKDILDVISLDKITEIIKFVKANDLYDNVVEDFVDEYNKKQKLSCIMVTEHGKKTEKIIGILTTWDIIGKR